LAKKFGPNAVEDACAAALEVQRVIRDDGLLDNVRVMGARLETALTERFGNHRHVGDKEGPYAFTTPDQLIADFQHDIARWNNENRHS